MCQKNETPTILMTACINPHGMSQTKIQNVELRKQQYFEALNFYLDRTGYDIVFVENSGFDITSYYKNTIENGRLEVITYDGNNFNKALGKGYGEGLILKYAFEHSTFIQDKNVPIVKVSGRHLVKNIRNIVWLSSLLTINKEFISCDINPKAKSANSDLFIASKNFYSNYFIKRCSDIDESKGVWFEHILYFSIIDFVSRDSGDFIFLPLPLSQKGYSGSTGQKLPPPLR